MATLTLTLTVTPDEKATEILDTFCAAHAYDPSGGLTKLQFLRREVAGYIMESYREQKKRALDAATANALRSDIDSITIG